MDVFDRSGDERDTDAFDPLTDILFSAIAVVFVSLLALAPTLARPRAPAATNEERDRVTVAGADVPVILATAKGLRIDATDAPLVALDGIAENAEVKATLARAAQTPDARLALMIEPGGGEAAFLLDPMLAAAGVRSVIQVRLLKPCGAGARGFSACLDPPESGAAR